jgi:hypothetical protein
LFTPLAPAVQLKVTLLPVLTIELLTFKLLGAPTAVMVTGSSKVELPEIVPAITKALIEILKLA